MQAATERAILPRWRQLGADEITAKPSTGTLPDVVTIADHEAEAILAEGLARLLPEASIVGEEACAADPGVFSRLGDATCWIISRSTAPTISPPGLPPSACWWRSPRRAKRSAGGSTIA